MDGEAFASAAVLTVRRWQVLAPSWLAYVAATTTLRPLSANRRAMARDIEGMSAAWQAACDATFMAALAIGQLCLFPASFRPARGCYKRQLCMALAASAACVLLLALATRPWHVLAVWALNGLVSANEFASCVALLTPWLRARERALYMSLWTTCLPVGGAIGNLQAAAGEWLSGSWRGAVALTGGACFLATAVVWHTLEPRGPVAAVGLGDTTDDENGDDGRPMEAEAASHGTNLPEPRPHASDGGAAGDADVVPVWRLLRSPAVTSSRSSRATSLCSGCPSGSAPS